MLPPLAVVPCDAVEEGLQEVRAAWSSRAVPRSTHCGDKRRSLVLSASTAVSSGRSAALALGSICPLQGRCVARNSMGQASRLLCPAAMALPRELDLDMGKMTVAATLGVPAGPAEEWLLGVRSRLRDRGRQPPSPMSAPCPDSSLAPTHRGAQLGGASRRRSRRQGGSSVALICANIEWA